MRWRCMSSSSSEKLDCVVGVETSCDDTGVAVIGFPRGNPGGRPVVLSDVILGQHSVHAPFGGIVPRLAARSHVDVLPRAIDTAVREAGLILPGSPRSSHNFSLTSPSRRVVAVAVTVGPGLASCLAAGLAEAKRLTSAINVPLLPVNHLEGHLLAARLSAAATGAVDSPSFPYLVLLVSGGHSLIALAENVGTYRVLANTLDDAMGEAFDKVARLINAEAALSALDNKYGLSASSVAAAPRHGGAVMEALARYGDERAVRLPVPLRHVPSSHRRSDDPGAARLAFSFSGLKSAVSRAVQQLGVDAFQCDPRLSANFAASFQATAIEHVCDQLRRAANYVALMRSTGPNASVHVRHVVLCGGVAANAKLREAVAACAAETGLLPVYPPARLCTDNAVMIAWAGIERMRQTPQAENSAGSFCANEIVDIAPRMGLSSRTR